MNAFSSFMSVIIILSRCSAISGKSFTYKSAITGIISSKKSSFTPSSFANRIARRNSRRITYPCSLLLGTQPSTAINVAARKWSAMTRILSVCAAYVLPLSCSSFSIIGQSKLTLNTSGSLFAAAAIRSSPDPWSMFGLASGSNLPSATFL